MVSAANKYEIIFVRHAESCANAWGKKYYGTHILYPDPEITASGIKRSKQFYPILQEFIDEKWNNKKYTIAASAMLRAQQTAFHMIAKQKQLAIDIFPFVCEKNMTLDNIPLSKQKQVMYLQDTNPVLLKHLMEGDDYRNEQTSFNKSDFPSFKKWLEKNPHAVYADKDGIHRLILFTHSHFLHETFRLPHGKLITNNGFIFTRMTLATKSGSIEPTTQTEEDEFPFEFQFWDPLNLMKGEYICPDGCSRTLC